MTLKTPGDGKQSYVLQPGRIRAGGWHFKFHKHLATDSQPFDKVGLRQGGWGELPSAWMLTWSLLMVVMLMVVMVVMLMGDVALFRQRAEKRRAEELLRLGQVGRLNTLGELAAGMAHELNQPLTALLADTQAASRLLDENPPELVIARKAMAQAAEQARRASDVADRLRRAVERPAMAMQSSSVSLEEPVNDQIPAGSLAR